MQPSFARGPSARNGTLLVRERVSGNTRELIYAGVVSVEMFCRITHSKVCRD